MSIEDTIFKFFSSSFRSDSSMMNKVRKISHTIKDIFATENSSADENRKMIQDLLYDLIVIPFQMKIGDTELDEFLKETVRDWMAKKQIYESLQKAYNYEMDQIRARNEQTKLKQKFHLRMDDEKHVVYPLSYYCYKNCGTS